MTCATYTIEVWGEETGEYNDPHISRCLKLAQALDCKVGDLFYI